MRQMTRGPSPPSLDGPTSAGGKELLEAKEFFKAKANRELEFGFKAYKADDVREALRTTFHRKCAYCESQYAGTQPEDVEHYRPKSGYHDGKKLQKPGYWWLAAEWSNLLPSCIDCNRARRQDLGEGPKTVAGKANQFPLAPGSKRARRPGQEAMEKPLLLDPTIEDPMDHLEFTEKGVVRSRLVDGQESPRGGATITVVALQRRDLVELRKEVARKVLVAIEHVQETMADIKDTSQLAGPSPSDRRERLVRLRDRLKRNLTELTSYAKKDAPYSGMAEEMIRAFRQSVGI